VRREVTLEDLLEREHEMGWPFRVREDAAEEALRQRLVAEHRWADFPILKCFTCGEMRPATSFVHDKRCTRRQERGYTCVGCREVAK
jgi:hypothetical protein